jgi:hypothetical protein
MDTLRKVTSEFDTEFERWMGRTRRFNGIPPTLKFHKNTRKALMTILSKQMQEAPPIKLEKINGTKKTRYKGDFNGTNYIGML